VQWPERGRTIILAGTRGEVPLAHREPKEPMLVAVPPGKVVLGFELWRDLSLAMGDSITFMGESFEIIRRQSQRGNRDDATMWIDLAAAQELLGSTGRINAILALKCHCAGSDLGSVRQEVGRILPGAQVIETSNRVLVRAEARDRARVAAERAIDAEREHRRRLRAELTEFASWFLPLVTLAAIVWIGLLTLMNVRERRTEIGILRAVGLRSRQIMTILLGRAVLIGISGAIGGYLVGFVIGLLSGGITVEPQTAAGLFRADLLLLALVATPLLAALASMPPSLLAVRQDPADVLRED
jgi:ABC-type lipoprotein release transport system permease subunit